MKRLTTRVTKNENNQTLKPYFFMDLQVPPEPVWTRRPLLSDVELLRLRLLGNRILGSDLSQLWAVRLKFISPPCLKLAITASVPPHLFEVYWAVSFDSAHTSFPVSLGASLCALRGEAKKLVPLQHDMTLQSSLLFPLSNVFLQIFLNSFTDWLSSVWLHM